MNKLAANKVIEDNGMAVARKALKKSIARWTDKGDNLETAIPAWRYGGGMNRPGWRAGCTSRAFV